MHEKLREAAKALREAAEDCLQRAARYIDLADRLGDVLANLQPSAAAPAAKRSKGRRGPAPKAGRKATGKGRVRVRMSVKGLSLKVTSEEKVNGKAGLATPAPEPEKAAPTIERALTPSGRIPRGSLDTPIVRYVTNRPGIGPTHVAEHFKIETRLAREILHRLAAEKRLAREGSGYHPVEAEASVQ